MSSMDVLKGYLSIVQAAERRGVDCSTIARWIRVGSGGRKLPHRNFYGRILVTEADLADYVPEKVGNPNFRKA
jgi:hypothetical protein